MQVLGLRTAFALSALLISWSAAATTIDFSSIGPAGDTESSTYVDLGTGLTVQGYYFASGEWVTTGVSLYVRNETNDRGLGVCSPADRGQGGAPTGECPGPEGGGDWNELDNEDAAELIVLGLPAGYEWVSVQLSSLDMNGGSVAEMGQLWADALGDPGVPFDSPLFPFTANSNTSVEPSFPVPASARFSPYLIFEPVGSTGNPDDNDYLVYQVVIERRQVMEPGTLGLLGIALLAIRRARRKN